MPCRATAVCLLLAAVAATGVARADEGKLGQVREEVRGGSSSGTEGGSNASETSETPYWGDGHEVSDYEAADACPPDDPDCAESDALEILFGYCLGFLFWAPHVLIEGEEEYHADGHFAPHPYSPGNPGYMRFSAPLQAPRLEVKTTDEGDLLIGDGDVVHPVVPANTRPVALRLSAEYGHTFEHIYRPAAYLLLSTAWRIGLESGWTFYYEDLSDEPLAAVDAQTSDQLTIGDINLIFRFVQHEHVMMRTGLGVRLLFDDDRADPGFNFTYGLDLFPVNPLVLSASVDLGNLGRAFVVHGRGSLGVTRWGVEMFAGWDALLVGDVTIHGPIIGLRGWI